MEIQARLGITHSKLINCPINLKNFLAQEMAVRVPGAQFMPAVRRGLWDGYKRFFQPITGSFLTGLIDHVERVLGKRDGRIVRDYDTVPILTPRCAELPAQTTLRDYQIPIIDEALERKRGIIRATMNAGKSEIGLELIRRLRLTTLYLVPSKELYDQMLDLAHARLPGMPIGEIKAGTFEPGLLTIAMIQSIIKAYPTAARGTPLALSPGARAMRDWIAQEVECLIADEVHHAGAEKWGEPFKHAKRAVYRYGFSATPYGVNDVRDLFLTGLTGEQFGRVTNQDLVRRGFSVPTEVYFIKYKHTGFGLSHYTGREYRELVEAGIDENPQRLGALAKVLPKHLDAGERVLVMVDTINAGDYAYARMREKTIKVQTLYGKDQRNRRRILEQFTSGSIPVLITTLLKEGVNIPEIDVVVNLGAKSSAIRTVQQAGRVLRIRDGKTKGTIYDFIDPEHKLLLAASRNRYKAYKDEGYTMDLIDTTITGDTHGP